MKYLTIILVTFLIASAITVMGVFIMQSININGRTFTDMKNLPYGIAIGFNLFLALGTLPIFLNLKRRVKDNFVLRACSFFALPLLIMIYLVLLLEEEAWTGILFCIPYFIILTVLFMRFRNSDGKIS